MSCFVITLAKGQVIVAFADDRQHAARAAHMHSSAPAASIIQADATYVLPNTLNGRTLQVVEPKPDE